MIGAAGTARVWPAYSKYGHWGESRIPVEVWRKIIDLFLALKDEVVSAQSANEMVGAGFIFPEVAAEFRQQFEVVKPRLISMIAELVAWLEARLKIYPVISIVGI